jgi:hypothetical protein
VAHVCRSACQQLPATCCHSEGEVVGVQVTPSHIQKGLHGPNFGFCMPRLGGIGDHRTAACWKLLHSTPASELHAWSLDGYSNVHLSLFAWQRGIGLERSPDAAAG